MLKPCNKYDNEISTTIDGKPLKAIMPPYNYEPKNLKPIESFEHSEILNDFAIDVTHIEKVVQDTDLIMIEKKY